MTNTKQKMKAAEEAIEAVFSAIGPTLEAALENMEEIEADVASKIEALKNDIKIRDAAERSER